MMFGMRGEPLDGVGQQVDAGEEADVVEQHRHGRRIRHGGVEPHERVARHHVLVERRRSHEDDVDADPRGSLCCGDGRGGRFAPDAADQRAIARNVRAHRLDDGVRLGVVEERRFAVRSQDDEPCQPRLHPARDVAGEGTMVDRLVSEWGWDRRKDAFEIHAETLPRARRHHEAPIATIPPMRTCSPNFEIWNSGRTNITLPAGILTPANPLNEASVELFSKTSRLMNVRVAFWASARNSMPQP